MLKITDDFINNVVSKADLSRRGRAHYNIHKDYSEPVQRLLNIANRDTYIRPHKHQNPDKIEIFIILKGRVVVVEFDENGAVRDYSLLDKREGSFAVEVYPGAWHCFISLEDGSCLYEIKNGPYDPNEDKRFAAWAPEELTKEGDSFNKKIISRLGL